MHHDTMKKNLIELIRRTSAFLPPDVNEVLQTGLSWDKGNTMAEFAMDMIAQNVGLAKKRSLPICQDTGTIGFYVHAPKNFDHAMFKLAAREAVEEATAVGYLRQNSVDSITGKNTGNNLGPGHPSFHIEQWDKETVDVRLVLKGGGCENMSTQYKLPAVIAEKKVGRDLDGVYACVMDAVHQAQGKGCGPGFLGVCIGGDRADGYAHAKAQLLRPLDDSNPNPELAALESRIVTDANQLSIGPMGFSGKFTLGSCKIGTLNRLPASFFVSVAYMCWAYRRRGAVMKPDGTVVEWLYQEPGEFDAPIEMEETFEVRQKNITSLNLPLSEKDVRDLHVGDTVLLNGILFTGRDAVHKYLHDGGKLDVIQGGVIYHCGPVVVEKDGTYQVMAAGPTTSIREEPYQGDIIKEFSIRAVIGKGGMGEKTLQACKEHGAVYLHAIGGAAQIYALCVEEVRNVYLKEQFGSPEAVWELRVKNFPAVVTMDSHGKSLHREVENQSYNKLKSLLSNK
ncbi:MAG TPA: FumA C-terminus/TtdB family hydratase beta subunit [Thermoanaerobaculia bacterium]|nr:FumA C-terminus/TtdB family hydratase beta subunit [Thermoanaerobaculia bacterium]HUM30908.1 FumA C-terminus/TtdB family hydratase beta subunit [Thermoanaerobaculia bacterium]HXK69218.1 FumA C-terminus/TtdB family hydratase beta subunit [Thermoanaerobaculia bacterium]